MHANEPRRDGLDLSPVAIVALGHPDRPVERMIGWQMAVGRLVAWVAGLRLPRLTARTTATRILAKN